MNSSANTKCNRRQAFGCTVNWLGSIITQTKHSSYLRLQSGRERRRRRVWGVGEGGGEGRLPGGFFAWHRECRVCKARAEGEVEGSQN